MELREYQTDVLQELRELIQSGQRKVILHAPTGAGKTIMAAEIIRLAKEKKKKVLFLANRRELIFQAADTLGSYGIGVGIIMAGERPNFNSDVQVCSMQTYVRRMDIDEPEYNEWFHDADIVIVDECTTAISPSYTKILNAYENTVSIGLTATPCRGDGRGLGEYYDGIATSVSVQTLINNEFLVPVRYFAPSTPDLDKIKTVAGDYDKKELGKRMQPLLGDIFLNWAKLAGGRQTIIFAVNVKHSIALVEEFTNNGVNAIHIDARTPKNDRMDALENLKNGNIQVISNVGILCEGFDYPEAGCIVLARPTKSLGLYLQMAGRGLRQADGKDDVLLLDHGGCIEQHGLVEWDREWSLDGKKRAWSKPTEKQTEKVVKCRACHLVFEGGNKCPDCGTEVISFGKKIQTVEAELKEITDKQYKKTPTDKRLYLGMLKYWVREKGYNPKMVNAKYKTYFDVWPHSSIKDVAPIKPDKAFLNLMTHDFIRYAKQKEKTKTQETLNRGRELAEGYGG